MSKTVLQTPDRKRVVVDPVTDPRLYSAPINPPNTGTAYTSGSNLYAHKARSGTWYFYLKHWSMWQGVEERIELLTFDEAEQFLLARAGWTGYGAIDEQEMTELETYGFNLLEETA